MSKIVGVGFQKTGTTSLRDALTILGYKVGDNNYKLLPAILSGNDKKVLRCFSKYDAVEDNPWPLLYKEIDKRVPGCKYILTIRDEESWYKSVNKHIGTLRDPMHEWIYGVGKGLPMDDKENTISVYNAHNTEVMAFFKDRPNDLLVIDITKEASWEKLCAFLGKEVPAIPFPHRNNAAKETGQESLYRKFKVRKKRLKYWIQLSYYRYMGYLK